LNITSTLYKHGYITIGSSVAQLTLPKNIDIKKTTLSGYTLYWFDPYMNSVEKNKNIIDKYTSQVITGGGLDRTILENVRIALTEQGIMNFEAITIIYNMAKDGGYDTKEKIISILNILQSENKNTYRGLYEKISGLLKTTISSNVYDSSVPKQTINESDKGNLLSVLAWFNSFLYSYISDVFDKNSEVVYGKLLMDFANSAADAVYNGKGFSRTSKDGEATSTRQVAAATYDYTMRDPIDVRTALVLRRIMREKDGKGMMSRWMVQNAADMTSYYKDRLRMVLPYYQTHLNIFREHCRLLREATIEYGKSDDKLNKKPSEIDVKFKSANLKKQDLTDYSEVKYFMPDSKDPKKDQLQWNYFPAVLTKFENYARTLTTGITNTLRDLDDSVVIGNIYYDSINDYVNVNGMEPLVIIGDGIKTNILNKTSPYSSVPTSNEFKYLYMFKSVCCDKYDLSRTYQILNLFNSVNNTAVSKELFEEVSRVLLLAVSVNLNAVTQIPTQENVNDSTTDNPEINQLIKYRESTNQIKTITRDRNTAIERKEVVKNTVAELNINPVNLKALTRNIPLANIYRYANLAELYSPTVRKSDGSEIKFKNVDNLSTVLSDLRLLIKKALSLQESSNTREGLMAIYDD
jgi:hypothetical protein